MAESTYSSLNGESRNLLPVLREMIGGIRTGWIIGGVVSSAIVAVLGPLIVSGFLVVPAKETDMKEVKAAVIELQVRTKTIGDSVIRLEEGDRSRSKQLDVLDGKLDRMMDLHLMMMRLSPPTSPGTQIPSQAERNKRPMSHDDNGLRTHGRD